MYNKYYNYFRQVIKLFTLIAMFSMCVPNGSYPQSCDRDGVCDVGEDQDNCVYDCMVSTLHKHIKLHHPSRTQRIVRYRINGSKEEITNIDQVKDFLLAKLDFAVYGMVGNYRLFNLTDRIPVVISRNPMHCNDLTEYPYEIAYDEFMEYNQHEEWFVHGCNAAETQDTRIKHKWYDTWFYNPIPAFIERFTDWTKWNLENNAALEGVYYDETFGWLNWKNFYIANCAEEYSVLELQADDGTKYKYIKTSEPIDMSSEFNFIITDIDSTQIYNIFGIWAEVGIIFLEDNTVPAGTRVILIRDINATIPQEIIDSWKQTRLQVLEKTRQKIGGKLMVYNGFSISRDYDNDFLQFADGGLTEGFIHTAGQLPHENFDALKWKKNVDQLQNISDNKKKIYLAQTTTKIDPSTTESELQKLALYAFTSFLLGKGDYAYFAFHVVPSNTLDYIYFDYWETDIGEPLEYYHARGDNLYEREFENVLVLVNPGESSATINLGAQFRTLAGTIVTSVTMVPKSGIILYKTAVQKTTTTSAQTITTTTFKPSTTTSSVPTATTSSVRATTTTSILPTTTTSTLPATTTSTIFPVTTSIPTGTTTIVPTECAIDADCDDGVFCNGAEQCVAGLCASGDVPCQTGQTCKESQKKCLEVKKKPAKIMLNAIKQPRFTDKKSRWLIVQTAEDTSFNQKKSRIILKGPADTAAGVTIDTAKTVKLNTGFGGFIILPIVVHKSATPGPWAVVITTEIEGDNPFEEMIIAEFTITK